MKGNGKGLRFRILGCYPKASRENFTRSDVGHPHELFAQFLSRYAPNASVEILFIADEETELPSGEDILACDGYLWTGSDLTIYHKEDPRVTRQIDFARKLFRAGAKSFGSCWGVQMAALAAGGAVEKNPKGREWGLARAVSKTQEGRTSPLLAGKPARFDAFIMHLDEVTALPSGTAALAGNDHTRVQAATVRHEAGLFWATQYHPEYNLHEMGRLIRARAAALVKEGFFESEDQVRAHAEKMIALHREPENAALRDDLAVRNDIIDPNIREIELRNWVELIAGEETKKAGPP